MNLTDLYRLAGQHHKAGDLDRAEAIYRQIDQAQPNHPQILHRLGLIAYQKKELDRAVALFNEAIQLNDKYPSFHNNLGNALKELDQPDQAEAAYRRATRVDPNYAPAHYNLAAMYRGKGQTDRALRTCRQAIHLDPGFADAHCELGHIYATLGQTQEAQASFEQALRHRPDLSDAYLGLGALFLPQRRIKEAIAAFQKAARIDPDCVSAYINLGALFLDRALFEDAEKHLLRALQLEPDNVAVLYNLGLCTNAQGKLTEARSYLERVVQDEPNHTQAWFILLRLIADICDWSERDNQVERLTHTTERYLSREDTEELTATLTLQVLPVSSDLHRRMVQHQAKLITQRIEAEARQRRFRHDAATPERLRVGYVSPDFRNHAVGLLIHDLFRHHDRQQVEVYGYALVNVEDEYQKNIRKGCDAYIDLSQMSPGEAAQRIYDDGIHILIDLAGHTTHSRPEIFALNPAPIQAHYLGYLNTLGADYLPYIIADPTVITPEEAAHYSESIVYLPDSFAVSSPLPIDDTMPSRSDAGLPEDAVVFCCFNHSYKFEPDLFDVWMGILHRTPGSVLWISRSNDLYFDNLRKEAAQRDMDPARLIEAERLPLPQHLVRHRLADLFLDTFTYNAGTTAAIALQAGLPVLTRPGERYLSRMGASMLQAVGLPDLICPTTEAYEDQAVHLASHPDTLHAYRSRLTEQRTQSPLFDVPRFARHLEAAYRKMWAQWTTGEREDIRIDGLND